MIRPWILAARPATLWASLTPVIVAAGLAVADDAFRWDAFVVTATAASALQVGVNYANDASDARRGADEARIGPTRAVAAGLIAPRTMWIGVWVAFGLAAAAGTYLAVIAGWIIIAIGIVSIVAALGYTGGPAPYGYRGLGEVFVFLFFGLVATVGSRYVHDQTAPTDAWLLAIPVGALITAILVANNLRDLETDADAGKRTLAVRIGDHKTRILYAGLIAMAFVAIALFAAVGVVPRGTAVALAAIPLAVPLARLVRQARDGPQLIVLLVGTARLQLVVGALLAIGAIASRF